ncbi:hypothetical protein OSTOST_00801 [Ostertagia ostertagi]
MNFTSRIPELEEGKFGNGSQETSTIYLRPTIPKQHGNMKITLSSITIPPTPNLDTHFISSTNAAVAENRIRCSCEEIDVTSLFHDRIEARLPIRRPWIAFEQIKNNGQAIIPSLVTAEILVHVKGDVDLMVKETSDAVCMVPDAIVKAGAVAELRCSSTQTTKAIVQCENNYFTVPCSPQGDKWKIRSSHTQARVRLNCSVTCGTTKTYFEVTGILKWTRTLHHTIRSVISGENIVQDEIVLPDVGHIIEALISDYKHFVIAMSCSLVVSIANHVELLKQQQRSVTDYTEVKKNALSSKATTTATPSPAAQNSKKTTLPKTTSTVPPRRASSTASHGKRPGTQSPLASSSQESAKRPRVADLHPVPLGTPLSVWSNMCSSTASMFRSANSQLEALQKKEIATTAARNAEFKQLSQRVQNLDEYL